VTSSPLPICLVLAGPVAEVHAQLADLDPAVSPTTPELVELRLDTLPELSTADLAALISAVPVPVLATCRPTREGGRWEGSEEARLELLGAAAAAGASWIDVEADAIERLPHLAPGARLVVSRHPAPLSGPPAERPAQITELLDSLADPRAEVAKLAIPCDDARDALTLLRLSSQRPVPTIAIGMGFRGVATRLLGPSAGAPWTYAAPPGALPLAAGQRSPAELSALPGDAGAWFGVLGAPVTHSRSPLLMNAVFRRLGLSAAYTWLETEDPTGLLGEADLDDRWRGFSVTIPHKSALLDRVELAPEAAAAGALNTLVRSAGGWRGHNTDGLAVGVSLRARFGQDLSGLPVALLGNGGAARAAAAVLRAAGAKVEVYARDEARGRAFANQLEVRWGGLLATLPPATDERRVILNATSVGMTPDEDLSPIGPEAFGPGQTAYDLVYTPPETRFLREAKARGAETISGVEHFLAQARAQLSLWGQEGSWGELALPALDDPWWLDAARLRE
jgi:3-dehydroquinate dehydratase / shikimate dehydrogenase